MNQNKFQQKPKQKKRRLSISLTRDIVPSHIWGWRKRQNSLVENSIERAKQNGRIIRGTFRMVKEFIWSAKTEQEQIEDLLKELRKNNKDYSKKPKNQ
jgi:hypothetical protein